MLFDPSAEDPASIFSCSDGYSTSPDIKTVITDERINCFIDFEKSYLKINDSAGSLAISFIRPFWTDDTLNEDL